MAILEWGNRHVHQYNVDGKKNRVEAYYSIDQLYVQHNSKNVHGQGLRAEFEKETQVTKLF